MARTKTNIFWIRQLVYFYWIYKLNLIHASIITKESISLYEHQNTSIASLTVHVHFPTENKSCVSNKTFLVKVFYSIYKETLDTRLTIFYIISTLHTSLLLQCYLHRLLRSRMPLFYTKLHQLPNKDWPSPIQVWPFVINPRLYVWHWNIIFTLRSIAYNAFLVYTRDATINRNKTPLLLPVASL